MAERWTCYQCGRIYKTKAEAEKCHGAPVQHIEDHPNPPKISFWKGR
jgi:rubredoxin